MKGLLFLGIFFLYAMPLQAASYSCQKAVNNENLVRVVYNYGELGFDHTKTLQEINQTCQDNAAGCFQGSFGTRNLKIADKVIMLSGEKCVVPAVVVSYDFSGSVIYVSRDYKPCQTRAVLRHELQHFMIWKTAKEWFLKDLKYSLTKAVRELAVSCSAKAVCHTDSYGALNKAVSQVEKRWKKIEMQNQALLDKYDHSVTDEVDYTVCTPYSLKVSLF